MECRHFHGLFNHKQITINQQSKPKPSKPIHYSKNSKNEVYSPYLLEKIPLQISEIPSQFSLLIHSSSRSPKPPCSKNSSQDYNSLFFSLKFFGFFFLVSLSLFFVFSLFRFVQYQTLSVFVSSAFKGPNYKPSKKTKLPLSWFLIYLKVLANRNSNKSKLNTKN